MSTTQDEQTVEATAADCDLRESYALTESALQADGTVLVHIIRPGLGKGRGNHYYPSHVLEASAGVFKNWRMYVDHQSDQARRAAGGLPRSMRDLGGRILESWWDPSVPADRDNGHEAGAVVARVRPTKFVRDMIADDPELAMTSINASATGVKSHMVEGKRCWLVEGIRPKPGSVDWVTEAGAGGKVVSLMEAAYAHDQDMAMAVIDSMSDGELADYLEAERPELLAEAKGGKGEKPGDSSDDSENDDDGDDGRMEEMVKRFMANGMPEAAARKAAAKAMKVKEGDAGHARSSDMREDTVGDTIDAEALREALSSPEGREVLTDIVDAEVEARLGPLVEARIEEERELLRAESSGEMARGMQLRDMRDIAYGLIEAAKLPVPIADRLKRRFALTESGPTDDLDVLDEVDAEMNVVKSAPASLREAVEAAISEERDVLAQINPTVVRGPGGNKAHRLIESSEEDGKRTLKRRPTTGSPLTDKLLTDAGFKRDSLPKVYGS